MRGLGNLLPGHLNYLREDELHRRVSPRRGVLFASRSGERRRRPGRLQRSRPGSVELAPLLLVTDLGNPRSCDR